MKKKGDLARQLLAAKEDELKMLGEQLVALKEAEKQWLEERETASRVLPPSSPVPGPVTGAALAAMTPPGLGSASFENVDLNTPANGRLYGAPTATTMVGLGGTLRHPPVGENRNAALRLMQSQIALLASENQALKTRLLGAGTNVVGAVSSADPSLLTSLEREQYMRQAFCALFRANEGIEMQNLARVMCAILGLNEQQQGEVLARCETFGAVTMAQSAVTSLGSSLQQQINSLFA